MNTLIENEMTPKPAAVAAEYSEDGTRTRGWRVIGKGSECHIADVWSEKGKPLSYETAKSKALRHVLKRLARAEKETKQCRKRVDELDSGAWLKKGAMPPYEAWQSSYDGMLAIGESTDEVGALLGVDLSQRIDYETATGDWWYPYAKDGPGVWRQDFTVPKSKPGRLRRSLALTEMRSVIDEHLRRYETMPIGELQDLVGPRLTVSGQDPHGTEYHIITEVRLSHGRPEGIAVHVEIYDWQGQCFNDSWSIYRPLGGSDPDKKIDWVKEGL